MAAAAGESFASQQASGNVTPTERSKFQSPLPAQSSITPPPSSQPYAAPPLHVARTPTPAHSHLSSPPPTIKQVTAAPPNPFFGSDLFTAEQVDNASVDELRSMLSATNISYREAKASAASLNLQYNLLMIETTEANKRRDVELDMAMREVEVARNRAQRAVSATPTLSQVQLQSQQLAAMHAQRYSALEERCAELEAENHAMHRRYEDLKSTMRDREATLYEENERLRDRIRSNRKHLNLLRSSAPGSDGSIMSAFSTPTSRVQGGPRGDHSIKARNEDAFSQLLLADQVLSQEANTTPSTPTPHQRRRGVGHQRGVQSLSSLPSTPYAPQSVPNPRSRAQIYTPQRIERSPPAPQTAPNPRNRLRRRQSRDSTISASEGEEEVGEEDLTDREDVPESQASQEARRMLSKSASASFSKGSQSQISQRSQAAAARSSSMLQTKLYGHVSKPGAQGGKRQASTDVSPTKTKKGRSSDAAGRDATGRDATGRDVTGLGISGWSSK